MTARVTSLRDWQPPDPATLPPDRRAAALWTRLAPTIGYYGSFIEGALIQCPAEAFLAHAEVVQHRSGQYAILGEGRDFTREAVDAFASECGLTIDHFGDGLRAPENRAVVLRVTDAYVAGPHFGSFGRRFLVKPIRRFMPRKS